MNTEKTPLQIKITEAVASAAQAMQWYINTASISLTHRLEGKTRKQALEHAIGKEKTANEQLNDILDFVYELEIKDSDNEAEIKAAYVSVKDYARRLIDAYFKDAVKAASVKLHLQNMGSTT